MGKTKKILNLISLFVLVSGNVFTPLSYVIANFEENVKSVQLEKVLTESGSDVLNEFENSGGDINKSFDSLNLEGDVGNFEENVKNEMFSDAGDKMVDLQYDNDGIVNEDVHDIEIYDFDNDENNDENNDGYDVDGYEGGIIIDENNAEKVFEDNQIDSFLEGGGGIY